MATNQSNRQSRFIAPQPQLRIPRDEIHEEFLRASGPGGQNVNKVSTAVRLYWNIPRSRVLTEEQRDRLLAKLASRLDGDGTLALFVQIHRTREANRAEAWNHLTELVNAALRVPKKRHPTRPTGGSVRRRLEQKKRHSDKKQERRQSFS